MPASSLRESSRRTQSDLGLHSAGTGNSYESSEYSNQENRDLGLLGAIGIDSFIFDVKRARTCPTAADLRRK